MIAKKKKEPGSRCCVAGCKNTSLNSPGTTFYVFSQVNHKKPQTDKWIRAVQQNDPDGSTWQPKKFSRICSQHFIGNRKSAHPYSSSFVPTIFPEISHNARRTKHSAKSTVTRFENNIEGKSDGAFEQTSCGPTSQEPIRNNGEDDEILMQHEQEERLISQKHQETQVQFLDTANDNEVFECNRYVNGSISYAETQTCILPIDCNDELIRGKKTIKDKGFGTRLPRMDVAVGPDSAPLDKNSLMKCTFRFCGFSSITNNKEMLDLAGVTLDTFSLLLKILDGSKTLEISQENRLLIFLFKMKLGLSFSALSVVFKIHRRTIARSFYCTLSFLARACKNFVLWPNKQVVQATMPTSFNETYKNCRVVIDCTEIEVEQPRNAEQRVHLYSHRKKAFTVKILVGCTPSGFISFLSKCYGGRTTYSQITTDSGFFELLEPGDVVLANKDFPELKTSLNAAEKGIQLVIPPFHHKNNFSAVAVAETDGDARVRTQIKRIMQRIKSHGILNKFSVEMLPHVDDVLFMCCVLVNLQPPIDRHIDD